MADPKELYESAIGLSFSGEVVEPHRIHEKTWTVIKITGGATKLESILSKIEHKWEGKIWKGFIYHDRDETYRLYTDLREEEGFDKRFTVIGCKGPFKVHDKAKYLHQQGYYFKVK